MLLPAFFNYIIISRSKICFIINKHPLNNYKSEGYIIGGLLMKKFGDRMFIIIVLAILLLSFGIGTIISSLTFKNLSETVNNSSTIEKKYIYFIQSGVFKSGDNANKLCIALSKIGSPFIIIDGDKFRVIFGVYTSENDADKCVTLLKNNKFQSDKLRFLLKISDKSSIEIIEIIEAELQNLRKFEDKNVKGIKTESFKSWINKLPKEDGNGVLTEIKDYVNKLPAEITKENEVKSIRFLFLELKKLQSN